MERETLNRLAEKIEEEAKGRFQGDPIDRIAVLQYGDDPVIEPGDLAVYIYVRVPDGSTEEQDQALEAFHQANREAIRNLREQLSAKLPEATRLEFRVGDGKGGRIMLHRPRGSLDVRAGGTDLTPVMARLGPTDLETLDTLITAGIAGNRADAVRWTIARIRERPAYEQLRAHAREIEDLKSQF